MEQWKEAIVLYDKAISLKSFSFLWKRRLLENFKIL
ncbi:unnamed protein product [Paramecium sonneborni]|uniref:Tetratricopeptide repeat protein n=1 Tax=Paramecium sonneborni TaxID=65129 RepID=A0A8S1QUU4_9CILI|nr:unnamed protein product [Paramecium sonneborni]